MRPVLVFPAEKPLCSLARATLKRYFLALSPPKDLFFIFKNIFFTFCFLKKGFQNFICCSLHGNHSDQTDQLFFIVCPCSSPKLNGYTLESTFSAIFTKGNNFCIFCLLSWRQRNFSKMGSTLKGKNLLQVEQILSFKS